MQRGRDRASPQFAVALKDYSITRCFGTKDLVMNDGHADCTKTLFPGADYQRIRCPSNYDTLDSKETRRVTNMPVPLVAADEELCSLLERL